MSQVKIDFTARIDQVEQAMHRLEGENTKLIQKNRELTQQGN